MRRGFVCAAGALLLGAGLSHDWVEPTAAEASDRTRAQVITRDAPLPAAQQRQPVQRATLTPHSREAGWNHLVQRRVAEPAAAVPRQVSEQSVLPHMAEVVVGRHTRILVDAYSDLSRPTGGIDRNHHLKRAQRLHRQWLERDQARPAQVLRRPGGLRDADPREAIRPRAVIPVPTHIEREDRRPGHTIPSVPRPPRDAAAPKLVLVE